MILSPSEATEPVRIRSIATAFLKNKDEFLLMKRAADRIIAPGRWYGIGGHIEAVEANDPRSAILREIHEESGLQADDLTDLRLRCLVMRRSRKELVLNYVFTGHTNTRQVSESKEGSLHWVKPSDDEMLEMADVIRLIFQHLESAAEPAFEIGLMTNPDNPQIVWQTPACWLTDF